MRDQEPRGRLGAGGREVRVVTIEETVRTGVWVISLRGDTCPGKRRQRREAGAMPTFTKHRLRQWGKRRAKGEKTRENTHVHLPFLSNTLSNDPKKHWQAACGNLKPLSCI